MSQRRVSVALPMLLLRLAAAVTASADIVVPSVIDLGAIGNQHPATAALAVRNTGTTDVELAFISSCRCVALEPASLRIAAGASSTARLSFDPRGSAGAVSKLVLAKVTGAAVGDRLVRVTATVTPTDPAAAVVAECEWCRKAPAALRWKAELSSLLARGGLLYFYARSCPACTRFLVEELPGMERRLHRSIEALPLDIEQPGALDELSDLLAQRKIALEALPVVVLKAAVLQGERDIRSRLEAELARSVPP